VPPVIIDVILDKQDKDALAEEEVKVIKELSRPTSPPHSLSLELTAEDEIDSITPIMNAQGAPDIQSAPENDPDEINDMLMWINDPTLFNDVLPRQGYFKWAWTTKLKKLNITECLWQSIVNNTST
jgi:hypothetical protein